MLNYRKLSIVILTAVSLSLISCFVSCLPTDKDMQKEIEEYNSQLPKSIGDGLTEERIEFDSDGFNFVIICDEDLISMDLLNEHREEIKSKMIQDFKEENDNDEDIKVLEEYCKKSNKNYSYLFVGNTSGKKVKITITPEEL